MFTFANDDINDVPYADDNDVDEVPEDKIEVLTTQAAGHTFDGTNVGKYSIIRNNDKIELSNIKAHFRSVNIYWKWLNTSISLVKRGYL